jgi:glycosyltransferase involved in cell wall biosynthesis
VAQFASTKVTRRSRREVAEQGGKRSVLQVTIITLALDIPPFIDEAIASVPRCADVGIEHIIAHDGSDADYSLLTQRYPALRVLRGAGRGATAAANVALKQATGEFVFFLNSDDRMAPNALSALAAAGSAKPDIEVWTGFTRLFSKTDDGRETTLRYVADRQITALTLSNVLDDFPLLTARFIRRRVYERLSLLDEHFYTCSDRELMIRLVLADVPESPLNELVSELRLHEKSSTIRLPQMQIPAYLSQHVELARRWMADPTVTPEQRAAFKNWHARELLRIAFYSMKARQLGSAIRLLMVGLIKDAIWPWRARTIFSSRHLRRRSEHEAKTE